MRLFIISIMVLGLVGMCSLGWAEQRYNAFEDRWETVPDNSNWNTEYNAYEDEWSYQPDDANLEYNAYENDWEWDSGQNVNTNNNSNDWGWD